MKQRKALGTLLGYAFITERQQTVQNPYKERFFDMHRLVHMTSVWWLDEQNEKATWTNRASSQIMELLPHDECERSKKKAVLKTYLSHALHVAEFGINLDETARVSLFSRVGQCQQNLGQYAAARTTQHQSLLLKKNILGPEHPNTLTSMSNLALVLERQGKYKEAEVMNRKVLAWKEALLGPKHPSTLTRMSNLALVLESQGKYKEAEVMNRQTLALSEKVLGFEHPDTLTSMNNLAGILESQGKPEEAEAMNRQTLRRREMVLEPEHPDTLISVYSLAHLLASQHCYNESIALYERAYDAYCAVFGRDHTTTRACREHCNETKKRAEDEDSTSALYFKAGHSTHTGKASKWTRGLAKIGIRSLKLSSIRDPPA